MSSVAFVPPRSGSDTHVALVRPKAADQRRVGELLGKASRTFALTIPMLPEPLRHAMGIAYLLMRNADTIEDAAEESREHRIALLTRFSSLMRSGSEEEAVRFVASVSNLKTSSEYMDVLEATPFLMGQLHLLPPACARIIREHSERVAAHMSFWVGRHDDRGRLELDRVRELEDYCYGVAGIVGEMITDLISAYDPSLDRRRLLSMHANAVDFGIGLQLTNVLKDAHRDAQAGRRYVPSRFVRFDGSDSTGSLAPLTSMAMHRLDRGIEYTAAIPYDHAGIRNFCLVALVLASASLQELERRETELLAGADVKITRPRMVELVGLAARAVADNESMRKLWRDLRSQAED